VYEFIPGERVDACAWRGIGGWRSGRRCKCAQARWSVGGASEQNLLTQQLTLILAEQNLKDTQALLTQSSVALIKNLGGGWQSQGGQLVVPVSSVH
jgi:outer membrane protein TolC